MRHRCCITAAVLALGLLITTGAASADSAPNIKAGTYQIDPAHSFAHFRIRHMGVSTLGGRLDVASGTICIGDTPSNSTVELTLNPASVDTGNGARDEHLREGDGFFDVKKYPTITFKSSGVRFDDDDADEATVQGDLTLRGVTRPITVEVDDIACRQNPLEKNRYTCGFEAETEISRSNFGMGAFPQLVGDKVKLSIDVEASKPVDSD